MIDIYLDSIENLSIYKSILTLESKLPRYDNIVCTISGGADSDVVLDLVVRADRDKKVKYLFIDTGLEYQATKDHLKELEKRYDIEIIRTRPKKSIPISCKENGQPFMSKYVSEMLSRLQKHNFEWENKNFETLYKKYPNCKIALKWWCNDSGDKSRFNIARNKLLKEFMLENPPTFKISNKCCDLSKKKPIKKFIKDNEIQLNMSGVRKSEGGIRGAAYKSCFSEKANEDELRPIFYYNNEDKKYYNEFFDIRNSDCYEVYGLKRTGCCGCPFGKKFEFELDVIKEFEPKLYKAVQHIFGDSYEYTRKYLRFREEYNL